MNTQEIPYGYCHCGCGERTKIASQTDARREWVKGYPIKFCHGHGRRRLLSERFWEKVDKHGPDECWPWTGAKYPSGYGAFENTNAHRTAYTLAHGSIPDGTFICHSCDNPPCCNPAHLFSGTPQENSDDMVNKRRFGMAPAKLSAEQVKEIRQLQADGLTPTEIAKHFPVGRTAVSRIVLRQRWKHV